MKGFGIFLNVNYVKWPSESGVKDDGEELNRRSCFVVNTVLSSCHCIAVTSSRLQKLPI